MGSRGGFLALSLVIGLAAGYGLRPLLDQEAGREELAAELALSRAEVGKLRGKIEFHAREGHVPSALEPVRAPIAMPPVPEPETPPPPERAGTRAAAGAGITDVAAARARLAELLAQGEPGREVEKLLARLKAIGTPEAMDFLLEIMEMEEVTTVGSRFYAELLTGVEDPRVQQVSLRVLRRNFDQGLSSWDNTHGFIDLLGQHLDAEGAAYLLELVKDGGQAGMHAGTWAKELLLFTSPAEILALAESSPVLASTLYDSLASSGDPALHEALLSICRGSDPGMAQHNAYRAATALGKWQEASAFGPCLTALWSGSDQDQRLALTLLDGASENARITPEAKRSLALPLLEKALRRPELASEVLSLIESDEDYHVPESAAWLERSLPTAPPELQGPMRQALQAVRRSLLSNSR